ncbi:protein kinase domain-containing protein [Oscillatoria acuminata]|uniref:non-specific serine/threonine protein kinase n=1 Tax=Oscillatoria acuminata PCC 6304 TaxID=56110 RepID=K9TMP6_9CYAN|nr:serine/threonine-protein kinase [Oscillatoria acuminata]AFY83800.1 tetratricopeptide repeat protein,protein kinase family protein [Oscillatoria acuminata PCC 6304]
MSDRQELTDSLEWVSYCINPQCQHRQNPETERVCQSCGTPLFVGDRYRLISPLRPLNQNTSTELFEVEDWGDNAETHNPLKVLKVLKPTDNQALIRLFEQEARVLTALKHPQIPTVDPYSPFLVTLHSGTLLRCLVQEKIEGVNLEQWVNEHGPISNYQALEILRQLAELLKFVHSKGFFHRDIKPANIMRRPNGELVLIDFGTAREVSASLVEKREQQTVTRVISEAYTAPEQRQGKALPKSDLFALGRTMVYLLTGRSPLEFEDPETGELVGWEAVCPDLHPALASTINQLIHPISSQRTRNPEILLNQLDEMQLGGEIYGQEVAILATPAVSNNMIRGNPLLTQIQRLIRSPLTAKIAVILFLLAGIRGLLQFLSPELAAKMNAIGTEKYNSHNFNQAGLYYRASLIFDPNLGSAQYGLGASCEKQDNLECAIANYEKARSSRLDRPASAAMNNHSRLYILNQDYEQAIGLLLAALPRSTENIIQSAVHKNLGWAYLETQDYSLAQTNLERAIELNPEHPDAYCLLARLFLEQGNAVAAENAGENCRLRSEPNNPKPEIETWISKISRTSAVNQ